MLHFSKVLHVENRGFLYFSFKCTISAENKKCVVQVWTEGEQCHDFAMEEKDGIWKMVRPALLPQWIVKLEAQLQTVFCEYELQSPAVPSRFRIAHYGKQEVSFRTVGWKETIVAILSPDGNVGLHPVPAEMLLRRKQLPYFMKKQLMILIF